MDPFKEAKEWLVETMGMWWPDADEGKLREAAAAWREFADAVGDVCQATHGKASTLIHNNSGLAIDAFEIFWRRYYYDGSGWLHDLEQTARDMARAMDDFADEVDTVKKKIDTELEICAVTIAAGIGLGFFTAGLATGAAATATTAMIEVAGGLGIAVSETVATVTAATLTGVAFGALEPVTVDLAVAQPQRIAAGQQSGLSLSHAQELGVYGAVSGGVLGGLGGSATAIRSATGLGKATGDVAAVPSLASTRLAMAEGAAPTAGPPLTMSSATMRPPARRQRPSYALPLDHRGRATGVRAEINKPMLDTGSRAPIRMQPPGWEGGQAGHTRGHLLARSLGGSGRAPENIVVMMHTANNRVMEKLERRIYAAVDEGYTVAYSARPIYREGSDIPLGVEIKAKGGGLRIHETVLNR